MSDLDELFADLSVAPGGYPTGLAVDADLRVELTTGAATSTTARITGNGRHVRIDAEHPDVLLAAVDRTDVGRVADLLAAGGISVTVHGPRGPVATLGAGTANRFGRAITGSSRVAPTSGGALRLVWASRPARLTVLALSAVLVVLAAIGRLRAGPADDKAGLVETLDTIKRLVE